MILWLALLFIAAGLAAMPFDRSYAHYSREQLHRPLWRVALRITDWAKGGPWIIVSVLFYLVTQGWMAFAGETPLLHWIGEVALALLASFFIGSVILHTIKIFLGRRRPRDDFEHGLYGFRYFTWQLQHDSFPSGHSLTIFCVATILAAAFPALAPAFLLFATGLALTRALLTAHFVSDVLVGAGIGMLVTREVLVWLFPALPPGWF